jgi:hypothetical protein
MADGQGLAESDEVFLIADKSHQWVMGQWSEVERI